MSILLKRERFLTLSTLLGFKEVSEEVFKSWLVFNSLEEVMVRQGESGQTMLRDALGGYVAALEWSEGAVALYVQGAEHQLERTWALASLDLVMHEQEQSRGAAQK